VQILMLIRPAWLWYTKRGVTNVPQADPLPGPSSLVLLMQRMEL